MSFAREKRLLLGLLAFLAPLPLPFNEPRPHGVIGWPALLAYLTAVLFFLYRAHKDSGGWLRKWMLNVLGLAYLPILLLDLSTFRQGHFVGPIMHLGMFALVIKLYSLHRERDKWHATIGIFFLFVASMATSAHPAIVVYLAAFLALSLLLMTRFTFFHLASAAKGMEPIESAQFSMRGFLTVSCLVSLVTAIPLFAFLPRFRSPYIMGRSFGSGPAIYATGFSDEVNLDVIGKIRTDRTVALRFQFEGQQPTSAEMRFKGATYDRYESSRWRRSPILETLKPAARNVFRLAPGKPVRKLHLWRQPLRATSLILPVGALTVEAKQVPPLAHTRLFRDMGGGVSLAVPPTEVLHYRIGLAEDSVLTGLVPAMDGVIQEPALDLAGVTRRISQLAARVSGDGPPHEQARRLEAYLVQNYEYTLDFVGRKADEPVEDFLFKYKSGHCEYFASALVFMLRSQGIPARFVAGFLGGEYNPLEGYFIVRQSNAHAWVEAYLPEHGWRIFDPTPPAGRPSSQPQSLRLLLSQTYDYLVFRWDRHILSYGFDDQMSVFFRLRSYWYRFLRQWTPKQEPETPSKPTNPLAEEETTDLDGFRQRLELGLPSAVIALCLALLALAAGGLWWARRPQLNATNAYTRFRRRVLRCGIAAHPSTPPLGLRNLVLQRFPQAALPTSRLIQLYLRESFGEGKLDPRERGELKELLERAIRALRQGSRGGPSDSASEPLRARPEV